MTSIKLAELSYEAAVRALDLQERGVEQLRARTGVLLGASSLTASFLGAQAIQHSGRLGTLAACAVISLVCCIGLCTYVLLPKPGFVFSLNAVIMYEALFEIVDDEHELRRRLIYWLEEYWIANQAKIDDLARYFLGGSLSLVAQLAFWSWALAATIS